MLEISREQVLARIRAENPWWRPPHTIPSDWGALTPRLYLQAFWPLFLGRDPHRAVVLLGPRRVGKTVLLHHAIRNLLREAAPDSILFLSLDSPLYTDLSLEVLLRSALEAAGRSTAEGCTIVFDEIQYLRDWERHLKSLVDTHRETRIVASGSAAAALKLKSHESGAGRFTDFLLPPLTFVEFLTMKGQDQLVEACLSSPPRLDGIEQLNARFVEYLNSGGYPEVLVSTAVQADPSRFIRQDVIDKVLLRDLPSLYGIADIQELNRLFSLLAWNTGQEISLEELSKGSGVAKNTIRRYIEYLRAAFLVDVLHRVDRSAGTFKRATRFKVYVTNPSMRAALFAPEPAESTAVGFLAETAIFSQNLPRHSEQVYYARWDDGGGGEIDFVHKDARGAIHYVLEVKWTDRYFEQPHELRFASFHALSEGITPIVTTLTKHGRKRHAGIEIAYWPTSVLAVVIGMAHIAGAEIDTLLGGSDEDRALARRSLTMFGAGDSRDLLTSLFD